MSKNERLQSEKEFHNETFSKKTRSATGKYYKSANLGKEKYQKTLFADVNGKRVLEYGCGPGSAAFDLARKGAKVTAIDIADVAIEMAEKQANEEGLDIDFFVMDAENLNFEDDTFDMICGSGILHHLDLRASYNEIRRTLKKEGKAVFFEPLGHNPVINLYRNLTPSMRTDDEHPLLMEDIKMAESYFQKTTTHYFNLTATAAAFVPFLSEPLHKLDAVLFRNITFLKKYAWIVVLEFHSPRKVET
ncbi:MAG: class I SAM-dependent methyltransferase, partial [Gracilimonas sp.]|nr:class I SAM-dependent methyltransferase [Gracilimonas sp.]